MQDEIIVIGSWESGESRTLRLQDFVTDDEAFIPIFSDEATFRHQVQGSSFEDQGVAIDRILLSSMLRGDETLILDPGGPDPRRLTKADLMSDGSRVGGH